MSEKTVHSFSVFNRNNRFTRFLYVPVKPTDENPTDTQILSATKKVSRYVNFHEPDAIVSYLGIREEAMSLNNPDPDDSIGTPAGVTTNTRERIGVGPVPDRR